MKALRRKYDASDLKELMDNTAGWARDWDDVIDYIQGPGRYDSDFAKDEVPEIAMDIEKLKQEHVPFTLDYRKIYEVITGKSGKGLKPPPKKTYGKTITNPNELKSKWLKGMCFPAGKQDAIAAGERNHAPDAVKAILNKIKDKQYENRDMLMEEIGDFAWHD
jgi:hypothetical protein